ncbi:MAG TPA: acyl-CoA dehydrogenase family protein [Methylomirabilota bacterium]|nr:acyl-CoA dehydrogenase family protein [Methylomirabilota bacterium]
MKVFSEQHEMFRATVRAFVDKAVAPHVDFH